jgi:hypothetical protein
MDKMLFELRKYLYKKRRDLNFMVLSACFCALITIVIVFYFLAYKPLQVKHREQMNTLYTLIVNIDRLPELVTSSEEMDKKITEMNDIYNSLNEIVPDKRNIPYVTSQMALAAEKNNVKISEMTKSLDSTIKMGGNDFGVVQYILTCISSYEDTVNFLSTLETSKGIFAIDKIKIESLNEKERAKYNDPSKIKLTLDINIYMKSNKK